VVDSPGTDTEVLGALAEFFVHEGTLGDTLLRVAELAVRISDADMAGITMLVEGRPRTGVFTDPEAPQIDERQYETGSGPCLDAFRDAKIYRIESTLEDTPWPEFAKRAAEEGVLSTLSVPIIARDESLAALNLYARRLAAFDEEATERMALFARHAAVVLVNAQVYWDARTLNENLNQAMRSRATIDYATGILMAAGGRNPEEAFQLLVRASQRENRKLREIAREIVERAAQRVKPDGTHRLD
jgi:GAF domain-containing protein